LPEGDDDLSASMGEERIVSGGVYDHGPLALAAGCELS
jgi:hypothetical protein